MAVKRRENEPPTLGRGAVVVVVVVVDESDPGKVRNLNSAPQRLDHFGIFKGLMW